MANTMSGTIRLPYPITNAHWMSYNHGVQPTVYTLMDANITNGTDQIIGRCAMAAHG